MRLDNRPMFVKEACKYTIVVVIFLNDVVQVSTEVGQM